MKNSKKNYKVIKIPIKPNNEYYDLIAHYSHMSKNLYNQALYLSRDYYFKTKRVLKYEELNKLCKNNKEYPDYKSLPTAQSAQQTLKIVEQDMKSLTKSLNDYFKNPFKYNGKPKLPNYKTKKGRANLIFTNQNAKLKKDGFIHFPKKLNGFKIDLNFMDFELINLKQVRIKPMNNYFIVEIVYDNLKIVNTKEDNGNYLALDLGINNLITGSSNLNVFDFIITGKPLKSFHVSYNKQKAKLQSIKMGVNKIIKGNTKALNKLEIKREFFISDYFHKAVNRVIEYALKYDINTIILGYNKNWKQKVNLGSINNQKFYEIPFYKLKRMFEYKTKNAGLRFLVTEESYTSGTSFLDNESPNRENCDKSRRVKRGLFKSNDGRFINADQNAAYQIMKKVVKNPFENRNLIIKSPIALNINEKVI